MDRMSRDDIVRALELLAQELGPRPHPVELVVAGGAALALLYDARASTKDIDAFSVVAADLPDLRAGASRVASALGLPEDWLNDAAKGYVQGVSLGPVFVETPSLLVRTLAPPQLLAMKLSAWRDDVDIEDARLLLSHSVGDREAIWNAVRPHIVPGRELKAGYAFDDLWEATHGAP